MDKKILVALSFPLTFYCLKGNALSFNPNPTRCPTPAEIQAVGVSKNATQDSQGLWLSGRRNQDYGTGSNWTFIIGKIAATDVYDAYSKATLGVSNLHFDLGPVMGPIGKWVCYYNTSNPLGYIAVAVNPPITNNNFKDYLIK